MPNLKKNLTGVEFARIASLALGEHWQLILATGMQVDPGTVQGWVKHGMQDSMLHDFKLFLGARRDNISAAVDLLLAEPLKPWERGDELLKYYELLTQDPEMTYSEFEDNKEMAVRSIADLLHYFMHQITTKGAFIDIDAALQEAIAMYNSEPHSATPIAKQLQQSDTPSKDFIPYVLTEDPSKIDEYQKKFGITQDQAVDDLIETTDWGGQDLPHLVGNKGTPTECLAALRHALRAGGIDDDEK
jgi:hypothetical protein